jgi:pimeloyl-[acyl-carrier protein] methyl ester esterase
MLNTDVQGAGRDLVLLHGWGMNNAVWNPLTEELSRDYRLTLIELPGHGNSSYDQQGSDIDAWTTACLEAAPEKAVWIGWSLGGMVAQRAAMLSPERVQGLVAVCSSPCFSQRDDWPQAMDPHTLKTFAQTLVKNPRQTLERFLSLQVRGDDQARAVLRVLRQDIASRPEPNHVALEHGLGILDAVDLRPDLGKISCPILWLLGERDTFVPVDAGEQLETLLPKADVLILQGSAHAPFLSHTRQSLRALTSFLRGLDD